MTATQDSSLHPLLEALAGRLSGEDAVARAATQIRTWRQTKVSDGGARLTQAAQRMIEEAVVSLNGAGHGAAWVGAREAEEVTAAAETRLAVVKGLNGDLRNPLALSLARQAIGVEKKIESPRVLRRMLDQAARADTVLVEALGLRVAKKRGMTKCAKCNSLRFPDANCPRCNDAPTIATDEQLAAQQQVDSATGQVIVEGEAIEEAGGASLSMRGSKRTTPTGAAPAAPVPAGEFEQMHPRGRGGKWIAKGAGLGSEGPDPAVKQLQQRLGELGFHVDQNGGYGTTTEEAVKAFQTKYGLPPTGKVDETTVAMMRNPPPLTAAQAKVGLTKQAATTHLQAQQLQQGLQAVGYDNVKALQKDYGLPLTGKPDAATLNLIQRLQARDKKAARAGGFLSADELTTPAGGSARPARLTHAATEVPEEGTDMSDKNEKVEEASYSDGAAQPYGGVVPFVADKRSVGGQPVWQGVSLLADPADRTPGMDDFFGNEPVRMPPNLREAGDRGFQRCATCAHHNGKRLCALYSAGTDKDDLCDSYYTLSPVEQVNAANYYTGLLDQVQEGKQHASVLKVARRKLEEAVLKTGGDELAAEVAALDEAGLLINDARTQAISIIANRRIRQAQNMLDESALDESGDALAAWLEEGKLSSAERDKLPDSAFAIPDKREYPIHDESHARNALARVAQHGSPSEKKRVRAAVKKRHPKVVQEALALLAEVSSSSYPDLERKPGKQNWVDYAGGLPSYIERIAKHIHYEHGHPIGQAIQFAVGTVRRWCAGGSVTKGGASKSNVSAATKAKACAAVAEWEAKKKKGGAAQRAAGKSLKEALADGTAVLDDTTAVMLAVEEAAALDLPVVDVSLDEAAKIMEEVELHEANFPGSIHFDPTLHPRGRTGEFTDVLSRMMKGSKVSEMTLPHGVTVRKNRLGQGVTVHQGGKKLGSYTDPAKAADRAFKAFGVPEPQKPHYGIAGKRYAVAFEDAKGMKNEEIIAHALNASSVNHRGKNLSSVTHEGGHATTLYSYKEPLAHIDHKERIVHLNAHKYSPTTSAHRSLVQRLAYERGYAIHDTDRAEARRRAGLPADEPFEKRPAGKSTTPAPGSAEARATQAAQAGDSAKRNRDRAAELRAQGNHEHAADYDAAAARADARQAERSTTRTAKGSGPPKVEVLDHGRDSEGNPHVRLGKKLPNGTYLEADAKLHRLGGNEHAHFSVTGTIWKSEAYAKRSRADHAALSSGAISDTVAKHMPELKHVANMHLSDATGAPMHAAANGWYWYSDYDGKGVHHLGDTDFAKMTPHERAAHHLRVSPDELPKNMGKEQFEAHVETLRPKWQSEADQARATLESYGGTAYDEREGRRKLKAMTDAEVMAEVERVIPQGRGAVHDQSVPGEYRRDLAAEANRRATRRYQGEGDGTYTPPGDTNGDSTRFSGEKGGGDVFDTHELKIARDTLKMHPAMAGVMGGPDAATSFETVKRLTGKAPTAAEMHPSNHHLLGGGEKGGGSASRSLRVADGEKGSVHFEPEGYAVNMGYVARDKSGRELYRGPQWQAHIHAGTGIPAADQAPLESHRAMLSGEKGGGDASDRLRSMDVASLRTLRQNILDGNRGKYGSQVTGGSALDNIEAEFRRRGLNMSGDAPVGTARFSRPGSHNLPNLPNGHELVGQIKAGTRVTIMTPQGQERSGKAVMRSSDGGWVLNMGGAHGTPGLVDHRNIVRIGGARRKLREIAADVTGMLPNLSADPNVAALLKAEEATMVRLPLAEVLVKHGAKIEPGLRDELREALEAVAPKEDSERRLAEAREVGDQAKITLYETLVAAT